MNNGILMVLAFFALIMLACEKESPKRFGFNTQYDTNSQGLTIMHVNRNSQCIELDGSVEVFSGTICIELLNPRDEVIFSTQVDTPGVFRINEEFQNYNGKWVLKYRSIGGKGQLILHLNIRV